MIIPPGATIVRRFDEFDRRLASVVQERSNRHQLWLGRPGSGKTARLHRHVKNLVGHDMFPRLEGRVEAPIYEGRITPAKFFIRGWQHHLEPLLCLNDVSIHKMDVSWEMLLCQFLERAGDRTIRWDLKARAELDPGDQQEITDYLQRNGLLDQFLQEQGSIEHTSLMRDFDPLLTPELKLPRSYTTESAVILVANRLGDETWSRIFSRLRVYVWNPLPEEQVEDLRSWDPPVPRAILGVIESCLRNGEILNLDYRAVLNAIADYREHFSWEDALRNSFYGSADVQIQEDANDVLNWLIAKKARAGQIFSERDLYQVVAGLRHNKTRRSDALNYLAAQGWIERFDPPALLRPGRRGRRPGPTFCVLRVPE